MKVTITGMAANVTANGDTRWSAAKDWDILTVEAIEGESKEELLAKYIRVLQYRLDLMYEERDETG